MRKLIIIPWHDTQDFCSNGIMTRDAYILYLLNKCSYDSLIVCNKPRTLLNKPKKTAYESWFTEGSIPGKLKQIYDDAILIDCNKKFDINQGLLMRSWWTLMYDEYASRADLQGDLSDSVVYSNNPFAYRLILKLKSRGAKVIFDVMDNFSIHHSLSMQEQNTAYRGYGELSKCVEFWSANSLRTTEYLANNFGRVPILMKNGVLCEEYNISEEDKTRYPQCSMTISSKAAKYAGVVGYIGKIGYRVDTDLIKTIASLCPKWLFVYVGPLLKGQCKEHMDIFNKNVNVLYFSSVPSFRIPYLLKSFDVMSIPHSVGDNEVGGDPIKLYQYLMTGKPILTTPIDGVQEFSEYIHIEDDAKAWKKWLDLWANQVPAAYIPPSIIQWENRLEPMLSFFQSNR